MSANEDKDKQFGGVVGEGTQGVHKEFEGPGGKYGKHSKESLKADAAALQKHVQKHNQTNRVTGSGDTDEGTGDNTDY